MRLLLPAILSLPLVVVPLRGQVPMAPDTAARRVAMTKLGFIAGDWGGEATAYTPSGTIRMWQTEWVRFKLGGQLLLIEGLGRRLGPSGPADTLFNAVATVEWDPQQGYRMRSSTLEGHGGEFELQVSDSGFVWGRSLRGARVRYTMRLTPAGEWHEVGEYLRDGAPPVKLIEMRLRRTR